MDRLASFLRRELRRGFGWGVADCLLLPADWALALGHPDPAAPWRGRYADQAAAEAILAKHGGVSGLMSAAVAALPATRETNAVRGDIGTVVVTGPRGRAEVGAVCTGRRWAVRSAAGLWIGEAEALAIWRLQEA